MQSDTPSTPGSGDTTHPESAGSPPAEALFAMRVAGDVARQLHECGQELRFTLTPSPGRVEVLLCDIDGVVLLRMSASRALEIASGSPVVKPNRTRDA